MSNKKANGLQRKAPSNPSTYDGNKHGHRVLREQKCKDIGYAAETALVYRRSAVDMIDIPTEEYIFYS